MGPASTRRTGWGSPFTVAVAMFFTTRLPSGRDNGCISPVRVVEPAIWSYHGIFLNYSVIVHDAFVCRGLENLLGHPHEVNDVNGGSDTCAAKTYAGRSILKNLCTTHVVIAQWRIACCARRSRS